MRWLGYGLWNRGSTMSAGGVDATGLIADHADEEEQYNARIEEMRAEEYPMLKDAIYLDHAGTTLYSKTLVELISAGLMQNLLGNPHSASTSSQLSTGMIEDVRLAVLDFFNASPDDFDLVFVANATAGVKLVVDCLSNYKQRDAEGAALQDGKHGFWYGYHGDSHTSLIGAREAASQGSHYFETDEDVAKWINGADGISEKVAFVRLFSYPAQSNLTGRRLPLNWSSSIRKTFPNAYTLLDAAAYVSTGVLSLDDVETAPDFTVVSFYKIFGLPDLGGLIVRRASAHLLAQRSYFGGGTVDMVLSSSEHTKDDSWFARKAGIHEHLEDGTLPVHSIHALGCALRVHTQLYTSQRHVARHVQALTRRLYTALSSLRHYNARPVCQLYTDSKSKSAPGPSISFNLRSRTGDFIPLSEVQRLANIRNIHLRTGGVCNPGGIARVLDLSPWEMRQNFSAGRRCNSDESGAFDDIVFGKPTGVVRVSLGAMSTLSDVDTFVSFVREFYVESIPTPPLMSLHLESSSAKTDVKISKMTIYPIKSCAGWDIPESQSWDLLPEGLALDREWCVVHRGTSTALSMKKHPLMALIRPKVDLKSGLLHVTVAETLLDRFAPGQETSISIRLSPFDPCLVRPESGVSRSTSVCGSRNLSLSTYNGEQGKKIAKFFSTALGTDVVLARFPAGYADSSVTRHTKPDIQQQSLSNESPLLIITTPSLSTLPPGTSAAAFRANIILSPVHNPTSSPTTITSTIPSLLPFSPDSSQILKSKQLTPFTEESFKSIIFPSSTSSTSSPLSIQNPSMDSNGSTTTTTIEILSRCRRCQMVCIDPHTGLRKQEPFSSLWKDEKGTGRREGGKVWFGVHSRLSQSEISSSGQSTDAGNGSSLKRGVLRVGDVGWAV